MITFQYRRDKIRLEIVSTDFSGNVYSGLTEDLTFKVIKENFKVLESLNEGELITITCKGRSEDVVFKIVN